MFQKKQKKNKILMQLNLKNDSGHESDNTSNSSPIPVDLMTSRELQYDLNARISTVRRILKDTVRIDNFKEAILHNKHLFKNKYVLNIGCGIGIYSLFAAKAGAAKVYAVDDSNVIYYTQQVVEANGYSEIIKVIKGKITEIELPVPVVDVIVSDWMGNALLYETSCQDVIFARDKWLKKSDGLIFPDEAKLFMVAFEDAIVKNRNIEWWRRGCGFKRAHGYTLLNRNKFSANNSAIKTLNLYTATLEDLKIRTKFVLPIIKSGRMDGIGFTDPWSLATDWMQTKLFFDEFLIVRTGSIYYGGIEFHPAKSINDFRNMVINLEILKGDLPPHRRRDTNDMAF
ncbi:hypothetical protein DOY81_013496 [Sarcophaga bullata]|nr:hypothetical protein DOY81_013496 [Sarcophaga bullata]